MVLLHTVKEFNSILIILVISVTQCMYRVTHHQVQGVDGSKQLEPKHSLSFQNIPTNQRSVLLFSSCTTAPGGLPYVTCDNKEEAAHR